MMNKKASVLIVVVLLVIFGIISISLVGIYNSMIDKDVSVQNQWGKVQSAYQRRLDLIPNLVATVKGSAEFEKTTQTKIAELRSQVNSAKSPQDMQNVDNNVGGLIRSINVQLEAYPLLTSTENFRTLQDEIAGTENRIKWERDEYNNQVKSYQTTVRVFPNNILAGVFGFNVDKYQFFEAAQGSENPPQVNFSFSE